MKMFEAPLARLLLLGTAPRIAIAAVVILLLWAGFFWATTPMALA